MKIYLVNYDNGWEYDGNENYVKVIFDSYDKAVKYCLDNKGEQTELKNYFKIPNKWPYGDESFEIIESKMNQEIKWFEGDN